MLLPWLRRLARRYGARWHAFAATAWRPPRRGQPLKDRFSWPLILEELETRLLPSSYAFPTYKLFHPNGGLGPFGSSGPVGLTPAMVRTAYGINQITFSGGITGDGAGQTVAIVDAYNDPNILTDLDGFDQAMSLTTTSTQTLYQQYGPASSFLTVYNQSGVNITATISTSGHNGVPVVDPAGPGNDNWEYEEALDVEWAHAVAPGANILLFEANSASYADLVSSAANYARGVAGVTVVSMSFGATEFSGETTYDSIFTTPGGHAGVTFVASTGDTGAPGIYPAYSPNVLAVGGTTLSTDSQGNYISETGWSLGSDWWNTSLASGGGTSTVESKPSYQNLVTTPSSTRRSIPDVALDADPASGVAVYDSYNNVSSPPWEEIGGTSFSAPAWAALIAIADQGRVANGLAVLNGVNDTLPKIYQLPPSDFHDITSGNNGSPAGPGYNLVTGRGTPIANLVVPALAGSVQLNSPGNPSVVGQSVTFTTTVTGLSSAPTGTVTFQDGGTAIGTGSLSSGAAQLITNGGFETGNFSGWTQSGSTTSTSVTRERDRPQRHLRSETRAV